jgi:hypothetical protein
MRPIDERENGPIQHVESTLVKYKIIFWSGGGKSQPASCPAPALIACLFIYVWVQLLGLAKSRLIRNGTWLVFSDMHRLTTADARPYGSPGMMWASKINEFPPCLRSFVMHVHQCPIGQVCTRKWTAKRWLKECGDYASGGQGSVNLAERGGRQVQQGRMRSSQGQEPQGLICVFASLLGCVSDILGVCSLDFSSLAGRMLARLFQSLGCFYRA